MVKIKTIIIGLIVATLWIGLIMMSLINASVPTSLLSNDFVVINMTQKMPITYSFNEIGMVNNKLICSDIKKNNMRMAFNMIENDTNKKIKFKEVDGKSDIEIECRGLKTENFDGARYDQILALTTTGILGEKVSGNITLYSDHTQNQLRRRGGCIDAELHSIFLVFGFPQITINNSIMSPILGELFAWPNCREKIDNYIIKDLVYYYR